VRSDWDASKLAFYRNALLWPAVAGATVGVAGTALAGGRSTQLKKLAPYLEIVADGDIAKTRKLPAAASCEAQDTAADPTVDTNCESREDVDAMNKAASENGGTADINHSA
jgi:hypothetical protein